MTTAGTDAQTNARGGYIPSSNTERATDKGLALLWGSSPLDNSVTIHLAVYLAIRGFRKAVGVAGSLHGGGSVVWKTRRLARAPGHRRRRDVIRICDSCFCFGSAAGRQSKARVWVGAVLKAA